MFNTTMQGMSVAVNGGSAEENSQLCTVIAAALRTCGFRNVQLDAGSEFSMQTRHDADTLNAMRNLNPDLYDTTIVVAGESEDEMAANMAGMGFGHVPFAFQIERPSYF